MSKKLLCLIIISSCFSSCERKRSRSEIDSSMTRAAIGIAGSEFNLRNEKDAGPAALMMEELKESKAEADKLRKEAEASGYYSLGEPDQFIQNQMEETTKYLEKKYPSN